ncbi:MAG: hypothetical protein CMB99_12930 [Flavobacteriaceae bacterium]|nr:hypothetical protein [Flavobacteriaceae bacterium]|tara:strand:+ start:53758 stop:54300 length:543 start_codon:yes stop_codon:yes gene_type:complete
MKNLIYHLSRIFFYGFCLFAGLLTFGCVLALFENAEIIDWTFINFESNEVANMKLLIFELALFSLRIELQFGMILLFILLALYFYAYYFFTLKDFFNLFVKEKVFEDVSIDKLQTFNKLNYYAGFVFLGRAIYTFVNKDQLDGELVIIGAIHFVIALLLYYYTDLVRKGLKIQNENDLTI